IPVHSLHTPERCGWSLLCMPYLGTATLANVVRRLSPGKGLPARASVILAAAREAADGSEPVHCSRQPDPRLQPGTSTEGIYHLGARLADAVAHLHERGIVHRDLKPANVLLTPDGRPLLLDFDLSRDEAATEQNFGGTLPYMSPEQLQVAIC